MVEKEKREKLKSIISKLLLYTLLLREVTMDSGYKLVKG